MACEGVGWGTAVAWLLQLFWDPHIGQTHWRLHWCVYGTVAQVLEDLWLPSAKLA